MDPYALIAQYPDAGEAFATSFKQGLKENDRRAYQDALAKVASGAGDPQALATVYRFNPTVGAAMEQQLRQRTNNARADTLRGAESRMLLAGGPQSGTAPLPTASTPQNALAPTPPSAMSDGGLAPQQQAQVGVPQERHDAWRSYAGDLAKWADSPEKWDQAVDYLLSTNHPDISTEQLMALKGHFSPEARKAFMDQAGLTDAAPPSPGMAQAEKDAINADPDGYLKFKGKQLDLTKSQLKVASDINAQAMQILGGVHDDASLQAAKDQARQLYESYGLDPSPIDDLPDTYDPQTVHDMQMRGMDTSHQLAAIARENRVKIYGDNVEEDNARADRSEQSLEAYRKGELGLGRARLNKAPQPRPAPAPKPPTPTTVIGGIMQKEASGQQLSPAEQQTLTDYRASQHPTRSSRGGGSDLIGPVYQRGQVKIQYSKSAGKYVRVP